MAAGGEDVDDGAEELEDLAEDALLVEREVGGEDEAGEVGLEEDVDLEVRRRVVDLGQLDRQSVVQLAKLQVLAVADRHAWTSALSQSADALSNSAADETISSRPLSLVLSVKESEKTSQVMKRTS